MEVWRGLLLLHVLGCKIIPHRGLSTWGCVHCHWGWDAAPLPPGTLRTPETPGPATRVWGSCHYYTPFREGHPSPLAQGCLPPRPLGKREPGTHALNDTVPRGPFPTVITMFRCMEHVPLVQPPPSVHLQNLLIFPEGNAIPITVSFHLLLVVKMRFFQKF